ncbi:CoxG family protein [Aneurinibacillus migulanus]|uniref:CoxG family protein n=1 Tax=Aneurinibacillus migulanus TaxID=47500 RepID=UPI0006A1CB47|nr:carbon monoxide dehydrogenase subunit G [Aneurinibacillus migulanus]MCP1357606.1 carbon monoxide dehydrogenase subunit G [Aneurinibacillus migulanus]CEH30903.1 Carbon monoxide dehydrogenase subunit G [Aneurinibacillus migulanus]
MATIKIEYEYTFAMPREVVWNVIQDEDALRASLPGCKAFEHGEDDVYHAEMGVSIGPVKGIFTGEVQQINQEEPSYYRLLVRGKGKPGEIDAVADMKLDEAEQGTKLTCSADVQVTGVLASVGQRIMNGAAKVVLGQFFKAMDKEMKQRQAQC